MRQHSQILFLFALAALLYVGISASAQEYPNIPANPRANWNNSGYENYVPEVNPYEDPFFNSSYYPDYDQYNSPEYNQQPSDPEAASFPFHPV